MSAKCHDTITAEKVNKEMASTITPMPSTGSNMLGLVSEVDPMESRSDSLAVMFTRITATANRATAAMALSSQLCSSLFICIRSAVHYSGHFLSEWKSYLPLLL